MKLSTYLSGVEKASWDCGLLASASFMGNKQAQELADTMDPLLRSDTSKFLKRRRRQCTKFKDKILSVVEPPKKGRRK